MEKKFKVQPLRGVEIHNAKSVGTRTVNLLMGEHQGEFVRGDIMDANAVVQAIDELKGGIDTGHDSLAKLNEEVKTNATVINGTITYANKIAADLETESKTRESEDNNLNTAISNEATARANAIKSTEDKIAAEATARANTDKEINKKIDVINGDSKTDGSIKKAIADVIDAAPEAYDTLKEIADKLKDNDDLHAVIQEAITEKASNEALTNEVNRATAKETEIELAVNSINLNNYYTKSLVDNNFVNPSKIKNKNRLTFSEYASNETDKYIAYPGVLELYTLNSDSQALRHSRLSSGRLTIEDNLRISLLIYDGSGLYLKGKSESSNSFETNIEISTDRKRAISWRGHSNSVFGTQGNEVKLNEANGIPTLDSESKIPDSYIPTTVALKTDLSEYIKTSDADNKYLAYNVDNNGYKSVSGTIAAVNIAVSGWAEFDRSFNAKFISKYLGKYLLAIDTADLSDTKVYNTNGGLCDLNNYAKLTDGKVNTLIDPADITSTNGDNMAAGIDSVNTDSVTLSELATAFNSLLQYTKTLESALRTANLLHYTVISE